jgi:hypothetical protein
MHLPPEASPDLVLLRTTLAAQKWANERKLDLSIKPLTLASLNLSEGCKYPELDSQIKAARTRVLFEFTTSLGIVSELLNLDLRPDVSSKVVIVGRSYFIYNLHMSSIVGSVIMLDT